jgi:uncharacterized protein HemY
LQSLGELHRAEERWDQATDCLGDSLRLWRELGLLWEQARTLERLGDVHEDASNQEAAKTARREARRLFVELGTPVPRGHAREMSPPLSTSDTNRRSTNSH